MVNMNQTEYSSPPPQIEESHIYFQRGESSRGYTHWLICKCEVANWSMEASSARRVEIGITICWTHFSHRTLCKWRRKWLVVFEKTEIDAGGDKREWTARVVLDISTDISNSGLIIFSCKVHSLHKGRPHANRRCPAIILTTVDHLKLGCSNQGMDFWFWVSKRLKLE